MGLDQFAHLRRADGTEDREFAYWRKHPSLQGWMQRLYAEKTGVDDPDEFNCVEVELTVEDLDSLERNVRSGSLPATSGFFFGSGADDYYRDYDLAFVDRARQELASDGVIVYTSWW